MSDPLVSVIIPVYNVESYLEECLESVRNQTYKNIEIITVNDGSTDDSPLILERYAKENSNIKTIHQKNSGVSAARNRGLEEATGKYIYFLDSDDYILPETVGNIIEKMEKHQLDVVRFGAKPFSEDKGSENLVWNVYDHSKFFQSGKIYVKHEFLRANIKGFTPSACLYMVRADVLNKNQIRFKPNLQHEDELFSLELFLNTERAMYDANLYYMRRYRSGSIMTSQEEMKSFDAYYQVLQEIISLLDKYTDPDEIKLIKSRIRSLYISLSLKQVDERYKKEKLAKIKAINSWEKFYYVTHYHLKEFIKKAMRF